MPTVIDAWVFEAFWMLLIGVGGYVVISQGIKWVKEGSE